MKSEDIHLTFKERQVAILICCDYSNKQMAQKLKLSIKTVEKHRNRLYQKLKIGTTVALVKYAVRNNFFNIERWSRTNIKVVEHSLDPAILFNSRFQLSCV
jgi:DNA-binding CsgD family transcriptional regulator